jgi:hypothetical protein
MVYLITYTRKAVNSRSVCEIFEILLIKVFYAAFNGFQTPRFESLTTGRIYNVSCNKNLGHRIP